MIYFSDLYGELLATPNHINSGTCEESSIHLVFMATADGHELEFACNILQREVPKSRIYTFVGHDAQVIAANLR